MFRHRSGYELQQRAQTDGERSTAAGATAETNAQRTVAGAAVLSVFPVAFVAAASYPVVAAAAVTLTVGLVLGGRLVRSVSTTGSDRRSMDGASDRTHGGTPAD